MYIVTNKFMLYHLWDIKLYTHK